MFLDQYHSSSAQGIRISAEQASRFAKEVADDFNPIHDTDAKRFCVPGDLLFCLVLSFYGLSERMTFHFKGMVGDGVILDFPRTDDGRIEITDQAGRLCLLVERQGKSTRDEASVEAFARQYVSFSGQNFPHFLKPLMARHKVMFNPDRPLVIYESMTFELNRLNASAPRMELTDATLDAGNKRGEALLYFGISDNGGTIGNGSKKLVLSGLRPYDETALQDFIDRFTIRKQAYLAS